jgi:hypothetical protein
MSDAEPILSDFLTKEELAAELGRNARHSRSPGGAWHWATANIYWSKNPLPAHKRAEMACGTREP